MADLRNLSFAIDFKDVNSSHIESANKSMDGVKDSMKGISAEAPKVGKSIGDAFKGAGKAATKLGKSLTTKLTLPVAGFGAMAVKTVADFDDSMANVQKISGATAEEFDGLREKAKELGSTTAYSASEAASGMGVLAASGMKANDVMAVSEDMFNLMSAGSVDAETAASVLTNTMAQFNMTAAESGKIVDTFAATSAKSKMGVDQLEHGMSMAGSTLAGMNMDIVDSTAAFGHLANAGMPVEQLGTALNAMGREIKANSGDFKSLGVEVYDSEGKLRDMGSVMKDLEGATAGMNDEQRDAALSTVFSGQAMQGATNWLNQGADAYSNLTDEIIRESNAAETMAAIQEDTVGGAFRGVSSAMEGMMIEIGDVIKGPVQKVALFIQDLAGKFGGLSDPMKKAIVAGAGIAAAIGPVIWIGGKLLAGIPAIGAALAFMVSPIGLAIAGAVALVAVITNLWKTNEEFRDKVITIWENIKGALSSALESIKTMWETHGEAIKVKLTEVFNRVSEIVMGAFEIITEIITIAVGWITEFWSTHGDTIMSVAQSAWGLITGIIDGAMTVIQGVIDVILGVIQGDWERAWTGVQGIFEGVMDAISAAWNFVKDLLGKVIEGTISAITDKFHTAMDAVKEKWESIKEFLRNPIKGTVSLVQKGVDGVKNWASDRVPAKTGINKVPYDNFPADLHEGEMVLTKAASNQYRALGGTKDGLSSGITSPQSTSNISNIFNKNKETSSVSNNYSNLSSDGLERASERPSSIVYSPEINVVVQGNADESTANSIGREVNKQLDLYFRKLNLQRG